MWLGKTDWNVFLIALFGLLSPLPEIGQGCTLILNGNNDVFFFH